MLTQKIEIRAKDGLHVRPVSDLVKLVKELDSEVTLSNGVKSVKASSMLGVLSLGLKCGAEVEISVTGGDEEGNLAKVTDYILSIQ